MKWLLPLCEFCLVVGYIYIYFVFRLSNLLFQRQCCLNLVNIFCEINCSNSLLLQFCICLKSTQHDRSQRCSFVSGTLTDTWNNNKARKIKSTRLSGIVYFWIFVMNIANLIISDIRLLLQQKATAVHNQLTVPPASGCHQEYHAKLGVEILS
jgi:hypothetical protein